MFDPLSRFVKELVEELSALSKRIAKLETTEAAGGIVAGVHAYMDTDSIWVNSGAGYSTLTFSNEAWDTHNFFTPGGSLFTIPVTGRYLITFYVKFVYDPGTFTTPPLDTEYRLNVNAGTYTYSSYSLDPLWYDTVGLVYNQSIWEFQRSAIFNFTASDTVFLEMQCITGNLNVVGTGGEVYSTPWLEIEFLGS